MIKSIESHCSLGTLLEAFGWKRNGTLSLVAIYHLFWIEIHLVPGARNIRSGHIRASARAEGDVGRAGGSQQNYHIRTRASYSTEGCGLWLWGPAGCASPSPAGWTSTTTRSTRTLVSSKLEAVSNSALSGQLTVVCANQCGNRNQIKKFCLTFGIRCRS